MKAAAVARKPVIRIAVVESDPLRFVGFRALFDSEPEFELVSAALPEISVLQGIDLILLGNRSGQNLFDVMASLKATRPDLRIIVTGSGIDEETIWRRSPPVRKVTSTRPPHRQNSRRPFASSIRDRSGPRVACCRYSSSACRRLRAASSRLAASPSPTAKKKFSKCSWPDAPTKRSADS